MVEADQLQRRHRTATAAADFRTASRGDHLPVDTGAHFGIRVVRPAPKR